MSFVKGTDISVIKTLLDNSQAKSEGRPKWHIQYECEPVAIQ